MSRDIAKYSCRSTLPVVTASVPAAAPGLVCVLLSTEAVDSFTAVLDSVAPAVDPVVEVIVLGP